MMIMMVTIPPDHSIPSSESEIVSLLMLVARKQTLRKRRDAQHGCEDELGVEKLTTAFYGVQRLARRPLLVQHAFSLLHASS